VGARKSRPVLYEVVGLHRHEREVASKRRPPALSPEPVAADLPPIEDYVATAAPMIPAPTRAVRILSRRLRLDLGWPALLVAAIVLVVLLWVAFQSGASYARHRQAPPLTPGEAKPTAPAPTLSEASRTATLDVKPSDGQRVATPTGPKEGRPAPPPEPAPEQTDRTAKFEVLPGYHYLVIQHFHKLQKGAAVDAAQFLRDHGVECVIAEGNDFTVFATEPFLLKQKDAKAKAAAERRCEELKNKVRTLGKEYAKEHGYAFEQCYPLVLRK
jgi:hypothetical protein